MNNEKYNWLEKAMNYASDISKEHGFFLTRSYNMIYYGLECLEMSKKASAGFFKYYIIKIDNNEEQSLAFVIDSHYNILENDLLHNNRSCISFSTTNEEFENDKQLLEIITKKIILQVKSLNNLVKKSILNIEKKFQIEQEVNNSFDKYM